MGNQNTKILRDFNIITDRIIEARRSDIVLIDKKNQEMSIIVVDWDFYIRDNDEEKMLKYQELTLEIFQIWNTKTRSISIVTGVFTHRIVSFN